MLVNNAGRAAPAEQGLEEISEEQLERTFRTNVFGTFFMTKAALPHLGEGAAIINTTSVTAYRGSPQLIDYAATKGAIVAFTRSLAGSWPSKGIRVNGVAPGPDLDAADSRPVSTPRRWRVRTATPLGRPGQPDEVAPCYVFLASERFQLHDRPGAAPQRRRDHQRLSRARCGG